MLYLKANPLLREPLSLAHIKPRLLGHWGSDAGQAFTYIHFNRLIKKYDLNAIFVSGPGHGAPGPNTTRGIASGRPAIVSRSVDFRARGTTKRRKLSRLASRSRHR